MSEAVREAVVGAVVETRVGAVAGTRDERAALARATLARAELLTGARSLRRPAPQTPVPHVLAPQVAAPTVPEPAVLMPEVPTPRTRAWDGAPVRRTSLVTSERPSLPVPRVLSGLLPDGLRRGSTVAALGSTSLVLALLAEACSGGAWAAVVGQPTVGLLAAAQAGVDLERLAVVPQPGIEAPTVVAALLDGVDVVLVGPEAVLTDGDRRRLVSRARERGSVLLASGTWPGADVVLTAERGCWSGVGAGDGRLRTCELRVTRTGRGGAGVRQSVELTLPLVRGLGPVAPAVLTGPVEPVEPSVPPVPLRLVG
ncbi:hypothetical protein [Cellulomonas sp. WB94]|uniref:hypothetical protein n=1 Tax=Cellulomonas sp. WB94 TaxID=2173174 RepID=UPI001304ABAC|nr:hypothetical protein [Cellulomonas sp. WB94]